MIAGVLGVAGTLVALGSRAYRRLSLPFVEEGQAEPRESLELGRA